MKHLRQALLQAVNGIIYFIECCVAVHISLSLAKHVKIRTMNNQYLCHAAHLLFVLTLLRKSPSLAACFSKGREISSPKSVNLSHTVLLSGSFCKIFLNISMPFAFSPCAIQMSPMLSVRNSLERLSVFDSSDAIAHPEVKSNTGETDSSGGEALCLSLPVCRRPFSFPSVLRFLNRSEISLSLDLKIKTASHDFMAESILP